MFFKKNLNHASKLQYTQFIFRELKIGDDDDE